MGSRKLLVGILALALAIEVLWPAFGFLAPGLLLEAFKIPSTPDVLFMVFVLSWCLLFVAIACGLALRWVWRGQAAGWALSYALGFWWVGIGGSLFLLYGKVENLILDGVKGALIVAAAWASRAHQKSL